MPTLKLENQVANKELSEKLWELGVRVQSVFYWYEQIIGEEVELEVYMTSKEAVENIGIFPALTSSELGWKLENINERVDTEVQRYVDYMLKREINYTELTDPNFWATMLIYLIEQGLVKVEDINKQLD